MKSPPHPTPPPRPFGQCPNKQTNKITKVMGLPLGGQWWWWQWWWWWWCHWLRCDWWWWWWWWSSCPLWCLVPRQHFGAWTMSMSKQYWTFFGFGFSQTSAIKQQAWKTAFPVFGPPSWGPRQDFWAWTICELAQTMRWNCPVSPSNSPACKKLAAIQTTLREAPSLLSYLRNWG